MYGKDILCGISKGTFEIPHKISCPYIEKYHFYIMLIEKLLNLKYSFAYLKHQWNCFMYVFLRGLFHW